MVYEFEQAVPTTLRLKILSPLFFLPFGFLLTIALPLCVFQFVPFRDFVGGRYGTDMHLSKVALAREVLAEIPDQVLQYMRKYDIRAKDLSLIHI